MASLDDFATKDLKRELKRRRKAKKAKRCWYCHQPLAVHSCRLSQQKAEARSKVKSHDHQLSSQK